MSSVTIPILCSTSVAILNEIEGRSTAFQLTVSTGHKPTAGFIAFDLWEDGAELPHAIRLNADGTWSMTTEIEV